VRLHSYDNPLNLSAQSHRLPGSGLVTTPITFLSELQRNSHILLGSFTLNWKSRTVLTKHEYFTDKEYREENMQKRRPGLPRPSRLSTQGSQKAAAPAVQSKTLIPNYLPRILLYGKLGSRDPKLTPKNPESACEGNLPRLRLLVAPLLPVLLLGPGHSWLRPFRLGCPLCLTSGTPFRL
jgi:hypothetical protein